jgi:hypothetical protein
MKKYAIAMLLVAAPLAAQDWEAGLFLGQQTYESFTVLGDKFEVSSKTVMGARLGYSIVDIGPALFQVTAGYQPKASAKYKENGAETNIDYDHEHYSVGAMFNFKAMLAVGVGLDYRFEKLSGTDPIHGSHSTNYNRPWIRANVGYAFPTPVIKPFLGLEVAMPLTKQSINGTTGPDSTDEAYKGLAPKFQIGLYAGIRF